jgi:hypothetical protein
MIVKPLKLSESINYKGLGQMLYASELTRDRDLYHKPLGKKHHNDEERNNS